MLQNMKCVLGLFMLCLLACTENKYAGIPEKYHALLDQALVKAGDNATELTAALKNAPDNQKEGMAFLIAYMPERDLKELTADFYWRIQPMLIRLVKNTFGPERFPILFF